MHGTGIALGVPEARVLIVSRALLLHLVLQLVELCVLQPVFDGLACHSAWLLTFWTRAPGTAKA